MVGKKPLRFYNPYTRRPVRLSNYTYRTTKNKRTQAVAKLPNGKKVYKFVSD